MQQNLFSIKILDHFFSTVILKPSLHGFEFRFDRKFSNTHRSVSKGLWSLLKVVLRSQSRLQNVVLVFESHVNFTTRTRATTAEEKKGRILRSRRPLPAFLYREPSFLQHCMHRLLYIQRFGIRTSWCYINVILIYILQTS